MEGVTKKKSTSSHDCGDDEAEASWQASQGDSGRKFEVFLSFRGADTRKGFTGHLYEALVQRGISTFIDNEELQKGERVEELFGYIERSSVFVPIISKSYADSKWCLKEITKIVECGRLIIPVFFGVQPTDIRHQEGPFKEAFKSYESNEKLKKEVSDWKKALQEVGEISGLSLEDANGNEAELIKRILKRIMAEVNTRLLDLGDYPIGLDSRVDEVIERFDTEVGMVGICGMGGIGKTTLAKAVYNRLCPSFKACSFLANVRDASNHLNGIVGLQEQLLRNVLGSSDVRVSNMDEGISLIKQRIGDRKVLVLVDDVDHKDQLDALVGSGSGWFGRASRIIVTCRDESIFNQARQVVIYRVAGLDPVQSLRLFSQHAFGQPEPPSDWKGELSKKVVPIAGGLPLCLKVFGSHFPDIESFEEGKSMLDTLKRDQHKEVHERLKISYDSLDENTKCIFLDIICLFIYWRWNAWENGNLTECAMCMWKDSHPSPSKAIRELQRKSLISVNDEDGTFEVHDQISDMGRKIVQQQNPPSRFWEDDERLKQVLQNGKGTENIEGIIFRGQQYTRQTPLKTMSFRNMVKLRILDIGLARMEGSYHHLPNSLKFLRWCRCPMKSLPIDFPVENVVVLDLTESTIEQFLGPSVINWGHFRCFQPQEASLSGKFSQLKVLILRHCEKLKSTPDFRLIPNATSLIFEQCKALSEVHESIGDLQSLVCLNLKFCWSLKQIPDSISRLSSLEILNLNECHSISTLPEKLGDLRSLKKLFLRGCRSLRELPEQIGRLKSLKVLRLSRAKVSSIPESVGQLTNLQVLQIFECELLKTIPDISNLHALRSLSLSNCAKVMDVPGLTQLRCLEDLDLSYCDALWDMNHMMKRLEQIEGISFHRLDQQHMAPSNASLRNMVELRILDTSFVRLHNIVRLDLTESTIKQFLGPSVTTGQRQEDNHLGKLSQLKVLILKDCKKLKSTPNFRLIPNATELIFEGCTTLREVHESIGDLQSLVCLNLKDCCSLKKIPDIICRCSSLEILDLRKCYTISTLPEMLGDLRSLKELFLGECRSLQELPELLIKFLRNLRSDHRRMSSIPASVGQMSRIPESVGQLTNLEKLEIVGCKLLKTIPDISNLHALRRLCLSECCKLMDVPGLRKLRQLEYLSLDGCDALRDMNDMMKEVQFEDCRCLALSGCASASSRSESTRGVWTWSVTVSFHLPNVPHLWDVFISVKDRVPSSVTVTEVKAVRHDDSFIIFERAEREGPWTGIQIRIFRCGIFVPPKEEKTRMIEEKRKARMIRDGKGYRRIDVTFNAEIDFSGSSFRVELRIR